MDEERKVRFIVAPLLFLASMAWGVAWDRCHTLSDLIPGLTVKSENAYQLIALLMGSGVAVFALGVIIGTTSYAVLRAFFWLRSRATGRVCFHEFTCDDKTFELMWRQIRANGTLERSKTLYVGVTFDFDELRTKHLGVHQWIIRRWNAFSIAVSSLMALFWSFVVSLWLGVALTDRWFWPVGIVTLCFIYIACTAWRDAMGMASFQANRLTPAECDNS